MDWVRHLLLTAMLIITQLIMVKIAIHHENANSLRSKFKQNKKNIKYKVYFTTFFEVHYTQNTDNFFTNNK